MSAIAAAALTCCGPTNDPEGTVAEGTASSQEGVTFHQGFHKEELVAGDKFRWVQQQATFTIDAPAAGQYRLGLRVATVFSAAENVIAVSVNGTPAGSISTATFDFANAPARIVEAALNAGENRITLLSNQGDVRLGAQDSRMAAFGLVGDIAFTILP